MALKKDLKWAPLCMPKNHTSSATLNTHNGCNYHRIQQCYNYTHEHPQYKCFDCGTRFTPLERIDKKESYIEKVLQFFRWRINND